MRKYVARRLLLFIPTLVFISLLSFIISVNAPGDPVERMSASSVSEGLSGKENGAKYWRKKLGLDLPLFYVSIRPLSEPETLYKISDQRERNILSKLSWATGSSQRAASLYQARLKTISILERTGLIALPAYLRLKQASSPEEIISSVSISEKSVPPPYQTEIHSLLNEINIQDEAFFRWKNFVPALSWHSENQYHRWVFGDGNWLTGSGSVYSKGIIRGDFGISYLTRQPVSRVIGDKIKWSLFFAIASVLLAYLVSIPLGVWAGARKDSRFDKASSLTLFLLYSMPSFWLATLLLMTFANPDVLLWFPASGVGPTQGVNFDFGIWNQFTSTLPYLVLPLICYTYGSLAFLSRTMRASIAENMTQDYVRTAMAKGLPFGKVVYRHAFRNSLLPLITVLAHVFPAAIGGSVILETIFTIPGMGFETFHSIQNQNYPMIVAIFTITGLLTMTGYLVSDILYALADPRIKLRK